MDRENGEIARAPHSLEAEQGVLGCILLSPTECLPECQRGIESGLAFYDVRHQKIYDTLLDLHEADRGVDVVTALQLLRERKQLDAIGGVAYLASLPDAVPSAANLPHYLGIVREKFVLRRILGLSTEAAEKVQSHQSFQDLAALAESLGHQFSRLARLAPDDGRNGNPLKLAAWRSYNTAKDEKCLLGVRGDVTTRYLCRGGSGWIIGPSGIGKSSLAIMMAALWAMGLPSFGIAPIYPLRVTVIQAENDEGDVAEMVQGVLSGLGDVPQLDQLDANLTIRTEASRIGREFIRWLERVIKEDRADIVLIDPLLSFGGFDVSKQEQCSTFLRAWLNPVLKATGAAMIGMHHTGKPKVDRRIKSMRPLTAMEQAYEGLGSSELVNWARLIMNLREVGDGFFELKLTKRGRRAGALNPDGSPTSSIWLKQGDGRIWWEQVAPPAPSEEDVKEKEPKLTKAQKVAGMNTFTFLAKCPEDGESQRTIRERLVEWASSKEASPHKVDISESTARQAVALMVTSEKLVKKDGLYFKGPQA